MVVPLTVCWWICSIPFGFWGNLDQKGPKKWQNYKILIFFFYQICTVFLLLQNDHLYGPRNITDKGALYIFGSIIWNWFCWVLQELCPLISSLTVSEINSTKRGQQVPNFKILNTCIQFNCILWEPQLIGQKNHKGNWNMV